jgi:hypothetical protein
MSDRESYRQKLFAEAVAPYGDAASAGPHSKLSISLPTDLLDLVKASAAASGLSVSATIAASLRQTLEAAEQANLDRALELDAEESLAIVEAYMPATIQLLNELEW